MAVNCPFEITPYDVSTPLAITNIANFNYTNQDFWSMKSRMIDFVKERFIDDFNDFVESSLAIMMIENFAFVADTLSFKIDQLANEIFIDTVAEIDNAFRLSLLVGFEPTPPIAARSLWTAQINTELTEDAVIPAPYPFTVGTPDGSINMELFPADSENNPILDEGIIIPAGKTLISSVVGLEGQTRDETFSSNGAPNQTYVLSFSSVILDSVRVFVDGVQWEQVDYFTDSQPRREFRLQYNSDYSAFIIFGDNRAGMIPTQGAAIFVSYRIGGGTIGNITTGSVTTQTVLTTGVFPFNLPVIFNNYTRGEFGYNGDTLEDIRRKLPEYLRTQNRAVTGLDYKTLADQFVTPYHGQVGKATAVLRNYGCAANIIDIYILAREDLNDLAEASNELKVDLEEMYEVTKMFTDHVCIRDGVIIEVDITIDALADRNQRKFEEETRTRIARRLADYFDLVNWEYGQDLQDTDLIKVLADIREILRMDITLTTSDPDNSGQIVTADFNEIIRSDDIFINFTYQ
jgi:hypothetical protein